MTQLRNAEAVLLVKLQALYDIEHQLTKALPKMAKAANDAELKKGFTDHLKETENHIKRLEKAFKLLGKTAKKTKSEGIRGIIEDGSWVIKETEGLPELKDAMLASSARYAEHYEMAGYMSAIMESNALGLDDITELLNETLAEEQVADEKLADAMAKSLF